MAEVKTHGQSGYRRGCKCAVCRAGHAESVARWRARRRERDAAERGPAEPPAESAPLAPLESVPTIDLAAEPGPLELAFAEDLENPASKVAFQRTLIGLAKYNARVLDQVPTHGRMDLVSPVQLRLLEVLQRLGILGFAGLNDDSDPETAAANAAAAALAEILNSADG